MCTIVFPEVAAKKLICSPSANTLGVASMSCFVENSRLDIALTFAETFDKILWKSRFSLFHFLGSCWTLCWVHQSSKGRCSDCSPCSENFQIFGVRTVSSKWTVRPVGWSDCSLKISCPVLLAVRCRSKSEHLLLGFRWTLTLSSNSLSFSLISLTIEACVLSTSSIFPTSWSITSIRLVFASSI